ncbi:midasin isoform X1 [Anarrhichthys ocellatus]|uniref:midasin isoform X1 n=1 Tax=Anarrhichthys ocellatus TaxID=433405 RepID=UPI0012EEA41E|nr:midasin isoform X1 [Anarrhichthys ocellatus]
MENLELSLSSLGTISRHVAKSHNELSQYLSKQIWSQQDRQCILECVAQLLLEKDYTSLIARHLRPLVLDLLERNAERVKAGGRINHDLHERLCVALSKLLGISPDAQAFAARYFNDAPPVFQRLFFTSEESSAVQYGPRRMKLRDLMGATLRFLQSDCAKFRMLWDWSPCVSQLLTSDVMVRGYTAHCLAMVSRMTDNQKTIFLRKVLSSDEILHMKIKALEETQQLEVEKALVLANQGSVMWRQEKANKFTRGQVVSEDLSQNVVAVCGVVLPRIVPRQTEQRNPKDLVLVDSTCRNLRRLALAVASQKPVLLEGPIGCGKTALVEFMAAVTGHTKATDILKVQLGDQTDSKMLLGMYRCTDIPGKFVWQPGTLTQAVSKGQWILLEDIDHAPLDVISVLLPLMENKKLMIPGREDCIDVAPGFQFFATRRMYLSGGGWHKPQNSHAALLDKYWTKLQMGNMTREELKKVLISRYARLTVVADRLLDIYCQLTGERHSDPDASSLQTPDDGQQQQDKSTALEGRALSLRDLLKWCERISVNFDGTSSATAQHVFQEALDCFTAMLSRPESRLRMAEIIGSKLNISKEKAQHFCQMYQPGISVTELEASVGRVTLVRKQTEAVQLSVDYQTFAATRPSAVLLEQLAVCVAKAEPVLLVGETGTGKTSTVQHLARVTGHRLRVVNMNQQSDTADLLGGYKPVDHKQILLPLREAFEDLFSQTYSRKQNLTFLGHVQTCFRGKRWQDLLKLMDHVCKSALTKELQDKSNAALLQEQWEALAAKLNQTQQQIRACEAAMVFAFVEGTLAQAVKKGNWILLDEINLAAAETLECLSGLLEGSAGSLVLLDRGDTEPLVRHPDFRLFACMNPATDVGKRNLPLGLRNRFTELYVEELENEGDLRILVSDYLKGLNPHRSVTSGIISFYLSVRKEANSHLVDGTGHRPHYSLRTLCRALKFVAANPCNSVQRSLYEGFCLSFLTQLDRSSHPVVQKLVCQHILMGNTKCLKHPIPAPSGRPCVDVEGYWVSQGEMEPALDPSYILTTSVKLNLRDLARVVSAGTHPVLIQGETSVGKTSLIRWLAAATGNQCVRINNHEHTDIQEYIGCYSSDDKGKLVFKEGVLIDAMRKGYWIILDELNLAPTDVLEALNRLLDDNRELFVAETQEVIKAHPRFLLFSTQNPPGLYGGRKVLSRAFRNRFVELHFDELPSEELETILHQRCSLPPSYCTKLVKVMQDLQSLRRGSSVFAGKHGFITLRDLFRWADRYRLEEQTDACQDWLQHLADDGYMLLAGRVRKPEEEAIILSILEKHFKRTVNPENLFSQKQVTSQFSPFIDSIAGVPEEFRHVVWTYGMRRLAVLVGRALRFGESVLLVGDTGCGKTTICQLFAALAGQKFFAVNCHLHMETSDFLGGLRPVRHTHQTDGEDSRLFQWHDGPLVLAMKEGGVFLMDEISLADDSVLERLNSVLETEKSLVLAEKGSGDNDDVELIGASASFRLVATMNPGGDFGKKELSPALRNRFTEIWCPQSNSRSDLVQIIQHNLRSGLSLDGGDIAELMLDFIEWLTQQDFGRRCILSVRDILSWVYFLNVVCERDEDGFMTMGALEDDEEAEWDLRLDTVTAFIHAACLVYVDGIGSGTTASCADSALLARRLCLGYLQQRLSKMTKLDQEMQDALRVYDSSLPREPQWGEDFFGIDPFYIALGPRTESRDLSDYAIAAGTTAVNAQRLLRALKLQRPVLLEGSPGVGKTSLVTALAKASGNHLVRINLSEQTDVTDLFGTDLPVEGGKGGEFAWRDGPLLAALKAGHWVVLDELNLASQSVLEGLNACFDHRAEIYIPELGMSFQVQQEKTKIFGCQNPFTQGGGRKGLPKSFLNRFTQVFVDQLTSKDMEFIGDAIFTSIDKEIIAKMVEFNKKLVQEVCVERQWGQKGSPWEFNLRDMFRWCQLMQADQSPGFFNPGQHVALVYADRMRAEADKAQVLSVFRKVFGEDFEPYSGSRQFHITPLNLQVGFSVLQRSGGAPVALDPPLSITHQALRPLESLMKCVEMGWMTILVGPTASAKTSLARLLSLLTGHRLRVMAMNSAMDTTELLGGFEQVDIMRPWQQVLESVDYIVAMVIRRGLMSLDVGIQDTEFLLQTWGLFCHWLKEEGLQRTGGTINSEALNKLEIIILLLQKLNTKLKVFTDMSKLQMDFTLLKERLAQLEDGWTNGGFEWLDGMLVQALQAGDWLLMDNVNFCSASVLDRLNALLEPGGSLTINERGVIDGKTPKITPHPNFRLFLTMDPAHGELSRAMRNRGVEVYIPGEHEGSCWDTLDLKTLLHTAGVTGDCVCDLLIEIHKSIKSAIWDSPASSVASLLHAATLLSCQLQRGVDLPSALQHACGEAYSLCQRTTASQKQAQQVIEQHLAILDTEDWGSGLLCAGVWPDGFPSALLSTEDSCFSAVLRDGQVLSFCLNTLSLQGKRNRPLSLSDLQRALQSSGAHEGLMFSGGVVDLAEGDTLRLIPTAVRLLTERASHGDWILRSSWLSHLGKSYKYAPDPALVQVEAGNRALKAVFGSKLAAKGKSLAELLQPHSIDEYRILVDMRWNKQYLDILANKCNFEDEERYMEFLEALNAVANRIVLMMDREERSVICTCAINLSAQNCALRIATAFSKGTVDIGHLPHPVLMHLRTFFDLWDSFTLQAVQSGQPYISDHIMFEILQLLQWLDRFWDVCSTLPADSQGISVLSLHWQWVQKHLILRLPQLLLGDTDTTSEGHQELQAVSAAIQTVLSTPVSVATALKGMQKTLGKALPFKLESVAECASRLRLLSKALDVSDLRLDGTTGPWRQELVRLQGAGLGLDIKESLLEAWGLVLLANNQLDPQKSGVLERLVSSVEQQQRQMTSRGLLDMCSLPEGEEPGEGVHLAREELQQLSRRAQLWPLMEELAVLNQLRLSTDLLHLALSPGDQEAEDSMRRELSRHLRYCLQSTPMNVSQLQPLWFLLSSDRPAEELQFVWCELLSEALAALWTSSVTSDPNLWLKWDPLSAKTQPSPKLHHGADNVGPALLSKAVWSCCMLGVLCSSETGGRWEPSGLALLSLSHVTLGEWKERIQQLQDVSAVLWDNMALPALAEFRGTDFRLQGAVLRRQLQSMADLLPPSLQEGYMESCESLVEDPDPLIASQEIQTVFRDFMPPNLLPNGLVEACLSCLQQYVQSKVQGSNPLARSGVFWVNMGLLQIKVWTPQTIFDPAVKRAYKLNYLQQELALLQEEWRGRSLSSQLVTGAELEESSTTDGFQHPRIRYLWIRMQQVKDQIAELSRKQACRPHEPQYGRLFQELQHYLCSIGQASVVEDLLSHLLKALQGSSSSKSRSSVQGLLKEEAVWQNSQQRFCQRLLEDYPLYPDVVGPVRTGILQLRHGMRLVASQLANSLTPVPGLPKLVSCLLAFPSLTPSLPSYLARADFLCSRACMDILRCLAKLLPQQQDPEHVVPQSSTLLLNSLLYVQCHTLSAGEFSPESRSLFRHICQALVNEWDEQERRKREREQMEASLYRNRSRQHGSGLTEDEQEERDFRRQFPQFNQDFADIVAEPSLEGPADLGLKEEEEEDKFQEESNEGSFLSPVAMNTVVQVHQRLCLGYAQSLWYQSTIPANHSREHIKALVSSYQIASPVMSRFYHLIDAELDQQLTGSELLVSALLQNTVQGSGGPDGLSVASEGPYDFYQQPNMSEARLCLPVLEQLSVGVKQRLDDWPEHPALVQLTAVVERIMAFSLASPLAKFLNGLEILLNKAQDWENNASRSVSLRKELEPVTQLIIQWRKLELNCWSSSLDNVMKRNTEKSTKHWFSIYQLVERYLEEHRTDANTGEEVECLSLSSVSSTLQAFMEGSSLGEFHTRLGMLMGFHCHLLLIPNQPGQESLSSLLWNLHKYYSQFSDCIQTKIGKLRQPIEKELKDFVKISKWNDVSFWSIKQSVDRTHRTLFKFVRKLQEALNGASVPSLVEQGSSASLDSVDANPEETPIHRVHKALKSSLPGKGRDLQLEGPEEGVDASSLQGRLPVLTRKMKKLCVQLLKKNPVPELAEDLDCFTGEVISNLRDLQNLTVDASAEKDKQKSEVKHILQQKQRALSDLFKMLTEIGLSYRKGLTWNRTVDPEQTLCMQPLEMSTALSAVRNQEQAESMLFTELLSAWDGCQTYFYRSWARRNVLQTSLQQAAKELGLGNIERCRGFSSHLFRLLLKQRQRLAKLTEQWVHLRRLTDSVKDIKANLQSSSEDAGCALPPQASLQAWVSRGQALAAQCTTLLQQLAWLLQCCPEDLQQKEETSSCRQHTLRCPSPLAAQRQPPGCLMRRGDAAWCQLNQRTDAMLKQTQSLKAELDNVAQENSERALHTWNHFVTCCSAFDQLAAATAQMPGMEQLFTPTVCVGGADSQPGITQSLQYVRGQVEASITEFTTWKTQLLSLGHQHSDQQPAFCTEFSAELETNINTVLCAVQTLVKRRENEQCGERDCHVSGGAEEEEKEEEEEEPVEDLLKPGHLTRLLEEELAAEVEALCVGDVSGGLERLLSRLRTHRDSCQPPQLQEVNRACRMLVHLEPLLGIYTDVVRYYVAVSLAAHRSTGKLLSVLASIFTELAQKGFCLPQDLMAGGDGEGATQFHDYEGGGIGEGEGNKDVSDKIENEDQVEDTLQEGQEKEEEEDKGKIKAEDNAIEMSEDFDGKMQDGDENEAGEDDDSAKEEEEELDKKMGDLGEGQTDTLDERMWGDDDEDDDGEEGSDKEEESGQGMDEGESELVAKDDNLDAADPSKDKKHQDKDEQMDVEEKEKINEQGDEREFDEDEVDPYHGQQDKRPEPEAMDLPEDLNLDQEEEAGDEGEGEGDEENPFNIDEKAMAQDEKEDGQKDGGEEAEEGGEKMEEDQADQPGEENDQEPKTEEGEKDKEEEGGGEKAEGDEECAEKDEEEEERGQEAGRDENLTIPNDKGPKPKEEEEEGAGEDEEQPEAAERKEHNTDGQTGEQSVQSDTAVELAGEASERDQAKEEHGSGSADASQSEGHQSKLTARMASQTQAQSKTQSFKRKPGQADNERSTGDYNERVNKRLRTVERSTDRPEDGKQNDAQQESDLYEHIKQGETAYDAQTYDVASADQQKAAGPHQDQDDQNDEDVAMETEKQEEDLQAAEVQELKPEQLDSTKASQKGIDSGEMEVQRQGEEEEEERWKDRQNTREEERAARCGESTIHTVPELLLDTTQKAESDPEEIRRQMELQLEAWHKQARGTQEEESAAASMWHQYQTLTSALSQQLCEQLRLILEPTQAAKLKGDYRTGKRLNMRKVIPYIASQFRKDKIWLRRTKPSKREYQICLAVDDSSSMVDNHSKQLAFESLSVIVNALTLLEVGQVSVCSFGEQVQLLHPFQQQFNDDSGARILRLCQFQQKKTRIAQFLDTLTKMFLAARQQIPGSLNSETAQLLVIVSDGRGLFLEGKERVTAAVRAARSANVFIIFVVLDNPNSRDSILDIKVPIFKGPGELPDIRSYMDEFPFPFYVILRDVNALPETLSDALRQWFELVTAADQ